MAEAMAIGHGPLALAVGGSGVGGWGLRVEGWRVLLEAIWDSVRAVRNAKLAGEGNPQAWQGQTGDPTPAAKGTAIAKITIAKTIMTTPRKANLVGWLRS